MTYAEEVTRAEAARRWSRIAISVFEVQLGDCPSVEIPAEDASVAIARYNDLCGIRSTDRKHGVRQIEEYPYPLPAEE